MDAGLLRIDLRRAPDKLLLLCLATDAVLIAIHLIRAFSGLFADPNYSIAQERGFGETFQYIKEAWIALMLVVLAAVTAAAGYVVWAMAFGVFFLDDLFVLRERFGVGISEAIRPDPMFGLRPQDLGELFVTGVFAIGLFTLLVVGYLRSDDRARAFTRSLVVLLAALVVFGVAVDIVHIWTLSSIGWEAIFSTLEDGGEMVVMSLIVRFVFRHWESVPTIDG